MRESGFLFPVFDFIVLNCQKNNMQFLRFNLYLSNFGIHLIYLIHSKTVFMKKYILLLSVFVFCVLTGCTTTKTAEAKNLYGVTWELEYISGPRIAFAGLFPENKPQITLTENEKSVHGTTSCNGYGTTFTINGNTIKFEQPNAMTMRYCEGGGEQVFLQTMEKINKFSIDSAHKLNLMIDDVPMMRFKKIN